MGSSTSNLGSHPSPSRLDRPKRRRNLSFLFCGSSASDASFEVEGRSSASPRTSLENSSDSMCVSMISKESASIFNSESESSSSKSENEISSESSNGLLTGNSKFPSQIDESLPHQTDSHCGPVEDHWNTGREKSPTSASKELLPSESVPPTATIGSDVLVDSGAENTPSSSEVQDSVQAHDDSTSDVSVLPGTGIIAIDGEEDPRHRSHFHADVASIPYNIFSGNVSEISNHDERRNSGGLFWNSFSRRQFRRHMGSPSIVLRANHIDELVSYDRWIVDFSGDLYSDGVGRDARDRLFRSQRRGERYWQSRYESYSLHSNHDEGGSERPFCASGLHADGTCSCESLMAELSSTGASISRIIMLADALYEVFDEFHHHPVSLSSSMLSLPAPEDVVNSFPLKNYKSEATVSGAKDDQQCYICLSEYEEGDKIRVLPCCHEYHMACADKWLKEIQSVCPVCRGDVCKGITQASVPDPEMPSVL